MHNYTSKIKILFRSELYMLILNYPKLYLEVTIGILIVNSGKFKFMKTKQKNNPTSISIVKTH